MSQGYAELVAGRYQLFELIGRGGMGRVWRGVDRQLFDREVAVKEILFPPGLEDAERSELLQRFSREARAAAILSHPSVITIHDVVEHRGSPAIVMELVRGRSLATAIHEQGPLPLDRAAEICAAVLGALAEAHGAGIVHRDIKPANILLTKDRTVLTDFGIAHLSNATTKLSHGGAIIGTPHYMPPEQLEGRRPTPANDLWALGATLYHAVEGVPPFDAEGLHAVAIAIFTRPHRLPVKAGPLTPLLDALLTKDPAQRVTVAEAEKLIASVRAGAATPMPTKPAGAPRADYAHLRTQPQIRRWELSGHTGRIESVAFSPNGNLLASTGRDRVVRLWNPLTRQPVGQPIQIEGAGSLARRVAFSFDGKLLACTTNSQTVWLLDPRTGRFTGRIVIDQARPTTAILAIAFTPHWNVLAVGGSDNTVRLVDPLNGRLLTHTLLHDNPVRAMAFSPDGRHLAVSDGASVRIWDPSADKLVGALSTGDAGKDYRGIPTPLHSVAFSPDGTFCAAGGDRRTFIWEASTGRLHGWVEAPAGFNRFNTVAFSPDSTILATGDSRKTVSLWDPRTGAQIGHPIINGAASLGADVESLAFSPDGMLLATSAPDKIVRLWQIGR